MFIYYFKNMKSDYNMSTKPKIILLVSTINSSDYWELWTDRIYAMNPLPDLVIFAENNSWDNTIENLINFKLPHEVIRVWFREDLDVPIWESMNEYLSICHIRQLLITRARQLDPDYAIFLDDDVLPPKNLISEIVKSKKDLIGGYYYRNFPQGKWLCARFFTDNSEKKLMYVDDDWIRNYCPTIQPYKFVEGDYIRVYGTSAGCLALSQKILQDNRLNFYPRPIEAKGASEDFGYCHKAKDYGYETWLHRYMRCFHIMDRGNFDRPWAVNPNGELVPFKWRQDTRPSNL